VHETVDEREKGIVSARPELQTDPHTPSDQTVVDHVQSADLRELFAQHEKHLKKSIKVRLTVASKRGQDW
jgi:hypothetical protein